MTSQISQVKFLRPLGEAHINPDRPRSTFPKKVLDSGLENWYAESMKLTIKNEAGKSVSKSIDYKSIKLKNSSLRRFGMTIAYGVHSLIPLGYSVNYFLEQSGTKYPKPLFTISNYLSKIMKAITADKRCECGNLILCTCHDKCEACQPCEAGNKSANQLIVLASRVREAAQKLDLMYDDVAENASRDGEDYEDNY